MKSFVVLIMLLISTAELSHAETIENRVIRLFDPYVQSHGLSGIKILRDLNDPEYSGGADIRDNYLEITFGTRLEKIYPSLTEDGYSAIICHEIGHFLAGRPKKIQNAWASTESMSDYFATAICLKKIFKDMGTLSWDVSDSEVKRNCDQVYITAEDRNICYRSAEAGLNFLKEVHENFFVTNGYKIPFYKMYDLTQKDSGFYENYPSLQCRAETFAAGAYCTTSEKNWQHKNVNWACDKDLGKRPSCWFAN